MAKTKKETKAFKKQEAKNDMIVKEFAKGGAAGGSMASLKPKRRAKTVKPLHTIAGG